MRISHLLGAVALAAVAAAPALAADLPSRKAPAPVVYAPPVMTWSGFYVGVNLGGVVDRVRANVSSVTPNIAPLAPFIPNIHASHTGVIGGVQVGYNHQFGAFVAGLEADISGTSAKGTQSIFVPTIFPGIVVAGEGRARLDYLATVRGRLGYAITPSVLLYATGGLAIGGGNISGAAGVVGLPFFWGATGNSTRTGWTVGGGVEFAMWNNWSVKAEYLYYNLGSTSMTAFEPLLPSAVTYNVKRDGHVFRAGLNYRFGGYSAAPVVARY